MNIFLNDTKKKIFLVNLVKSSGKKKKIGKIDVYCGNVQKVIFTIWSSIDKDKNYKTEITVIKG